VICWTLAVLTLGRKGHDWLELSDGRKVCRYCEAVAAARR